MSYSYVQSNLIPLDADVDIPAWPTGQNVDFAFENNVKVGSLLIFAYTSFKWQPSSITDSQGNTWSKAVSNDEVGEFQDHTGIYYAIAKQSGACTLTVTFNDHDSETHNVTAALAEFDGNILSAPLYTTNNGQGTGTAVSPGSVTPNVNGSLIISVMQNYNASNNTISEAGGYTQLEEQLGDGGVYNRLGSQYLIQSTAGATTASFTLGGSSDWGCAVAVFIPRRPQQLGALGAGN